MGGLWEVGTEGIWGYLGVPGEDSPTHKVEQQQQRGGFSGVFEATSAGSSTGLFAPGNRYGQA